MRITIAQPTAELARELIDVLDVLGVPANYIGRVLPLRIGSLAYATTLIDVDMRGEITVLTLELHDSDLAWESFAQRVVVG